MLQNLLEVMPSTWEKKKESFCLILTIYISSFFIFYLYQVVQMLARDFGLDLDYFKRHHVCKLYSYGHDKLGEEVNFI